MQILNDDIYKFIQIGEFYCNRYLHNFTKGWILNGGEFVIFFQSGSKLS